MSVQTGSKKQEKKKEGGFAETVRVVFHALIIAIVIRTFLFQPFNIPSESMKPTLLVGDYLFVSKYSYGYTHYSLPFSPRLFSGRIIGTSLKRGDVVVFRLPRDDSIDYIKRVIGLPGDKIQMIDGGLNINGGSSAIGSRISSPTTTASCSASSSTARRCRTACPTSRSISPITAFSTTRRSIPCRPTTIS
jgi:signal peptidase I